jgi:hypothetical protein
MPWIQSSIAPKREKNKGGFLPCALWCSLHIENLCFPLLKLEHEYPVDVYFHWIKHTLVPKKCLTNYSTATLNSFD